MDAPKKVTKIFNYPSGNFKRTVFSKVRSGPNYSEWKLVVTYLLTCNDIRKNICVGCFKGSLYDVNGRYYEVNGRMTLDAVKLLVEQIRQVKKLEEPSH